MASKRRISGKKPMFGQSRSKAFNTVKRKFKLNMQSKRYFVPELDRFVRVQVTAQEMKTIDKIGLLAFLKRQNISINKLLPKD
ncbi:MAG: 50S ribosomal protein L28 [Anaerolineae bacterium]|nr:50S ribosomal protein L28 [Anaerolineae bacterium]MCA9893247.1 50S ribosomal protein L28 [Anaerolineae bacterium]MCB9460471.1 50S ribosomal protein L28 [Anaerolineaceae bacterium]